MNTVTATLIADGGSDRTLLPIIEMLLGEHTTAAYRVHWAQGLHSGRLRERLHQAIDLYPCDLLFVHRDAEKLALEERQREIEREWTTAQREGTQLVCVIPVRMTEAWLLTHEGALRAAVSNPNGKAPLSLPPPKKLEAKPDPKALLFEALRAASGLPGYRLLRFKPDDYRHRVSERLDNLDTLRQLPSFQHLEDQVRRYFQFASTNTVSTPV